MEIKAGNFCPLLQKECIGLECAWITQVRGSDPNSGKEVDHWDCAVKWIPMLLIENSQMQRQTGAAVESFRNRIVENIDMPAITERPKIKNINITNLLEESL